jgi:hypothetical protein
MAGRPRNQLKTVPITIATTPQVEEMLQRLVATGLYGKTPPEAAERIVAEGLRKLFADPTMMAPARKRRRTRRKG